MMEDEIMGLYGLDGGDSLRVRPGETLGALPPLQQFTGRQLAQWRRNWTRPYPGNVQTKGPWVWSGKWGLPVVEPGLSGYGIFPALPAIAAGVAAAVKGGKAIHDAVKRSPEERARARRRGAKMMKEMQRKIRAAKRAKLRRRRRLLAQERAMRRGAAYEAKHRPSKLQADPVVVERQVQVGSRVADAAVRRPHLVVVAPTPGVIRVPKHVLAPPAAPSAPAPWYKQPIAGGMPTGVAMALGVGGVALLLLLSRR